MKISALLNLYKRPHSLREQYDSLMNQSIPPDEVLIWHNAATPLSDFDPDIISRCKVASSNVNWGVHARLAYLLNSSGDYFLMLDDDVKMGNRWIESCLDVQKKEACLLGTIGIICQALDYRHYRRVGWAEPNERIEQVDFLGHNWFGKREIIGEYWRKSPVPWHNLSGEDLNLSFAAQRLGMRSLVPPHPLNDRSVWGSMPEEAWKWGTESHCISANFHGSHFAKNLEIAYNEGFKYLEIP